MPASACTRSICLLKQVSQGRIKRDGDWGDTSHQLLHEYCFHVSLSLVSFQTIFYRATHMERLCIAYMRLWLNEQWLFVQHGCQTGCQTRLTTGLTTGWMFVYTIQPVVKPVVQPV